jgi:hypothetical protein
MKSARPLFELKTPREFAENIVAGGFREPLVDAIEGLVRHRDADIIEAERASRGTGEREAGRREARPTPADLQEIAQQVHDDYKAAEADAIRIGCQLDAAADAKARRPAPAEPPTGHLEVAVRALEEIRDRGLESVSTERGRFCRQCDRYVSAYGHLDYMPCGIASRALAALRAAKETP